MKIPEHLKYLDSHEWIDPAQDPAPVGISDHAQEELSDITYVDLPEVGRVVEKGEMVAVMDSVKAASEIYAPVAGEIVEINANLDAEPERVNNDAYGDGWLFKIKPAEGAAFDDLLSAEAYGKLTG